MKRRKAEWMKEKREGRT